MDNTSQTHCRPFLRFLEAAGCIYLHKKPPEDLSLPEDQYTPVFVKFSQDENMVYFNYHNGLGIVSCATGSSFHLPISGQVLNIVEFTDQDIIFVLSVENSQYHVYLIEKEANLLGNFTFTANTAFIAGDSRNLYIGHDDTISRLIIQRQ